MHHAYFNYWSSFYLLTFYFQHPLACYFYPSYYFSLFFVMFLYFFLLCFALIIFFFVLHLDSLLMCALFSFFTTYNFFQMSLMACQILYFVHLQCYGIASLRDPILTVVLLFLLLRTSYDFENWKSDKGIVTTLPIIVFLVHVT